MPLFLKTVDIFRKHIYPARLGVHWGRKRLLYEDLGVAETGSPVRIRSRGVSGHTCLRPDPPALGLILAHTAAPGSSPLQGKAIHRQSRSLVSPQDTFSPAQRSRRSWNGTSEGFPPTKQEIAPLPARVLTYHQHGEPAQACCRSSRPQRRSCAAVTGPLLYLSSLTGDCCLPAPWGSLPLTSIKKADICLQMESLAAASPAEVCSWRVYVFDCVSAVHEQFFGPANEAEGMPHHERQP